MRKVLGHRGRLLLLCACVALSLAVVRARAQSPAEIRPGQTVNGALQPNATQDWVFAAPGPEAVTIQVVRVSGDLLPALSLLDPDGQTLVGTQATGTQTQTTLNDIRIPQSGVYTIRVTSSGGTSGAFNLSLAASAPSNSAPLPTPVTKTLAGTLSYGETVRGALTGLLFQQYWQFKGSAADVIDLTMAAISGDLDPYVSLVSPSNEVIAANDSANGGKDAGLFSIQLPRAGNYTIVARRSGSSQSQNGATGGDYTLTLTLKTPNQGAANTSLPIGGSLSGRLDNVAPLAEYRLEQGGVLAFDLDLNSLHSLARIRVLDSASTPLFIKEGISPLQFSAVLPDKGPYFVQVSAEKFDNQNAIDFTLSAHKLSAPALPLRIDESQQSAGTGAEERWFFSGRAGDQMQISIKPLRGALNRSAIIRGPGDEVIFQGALSPQYDQPVSLPSDGVYQIMVQPAKADAPDHDARFAVEVRQTGANGLPIERFGGTQPKGVLGLDETVAGQTPPGAGETWLFDAAADTVINLMGTGRTAQQSLGIVVRAPDGTPLGLAVDSGTTLLRRVHLPHDGRYTVTVFDPTGTARDPYSLRIEDAGGGTLTANQLVKGVLLPTNAYAEWAVDAAAGTQINAQLTTRTPGIWAPNLIVVDPTGLVIDRSGLVDDAAKNTISLLGTQATLGGRYRVIVGGPIAASSASYELVGSVTPLFGPPAAVTVQQGDRPPAPRFAPVPDGATEPPVLPDLITPVLPPENIFAPDTLSLPANTLMRGEIGQGELRQVWRIVAGAGVTLSVQATALEGAAGPDLTLISRDGRILAEQLRGATPSTTLTYKTDQGGDFGLAVRLGLNSTRYLIYYSPQTLRSVPLTVAQGTPIVYGQAVTGEMLAPAQVDSYYFFGAVNDVLNVQLSPTTGDLAPALDLVALDGKSIAVEPNLDRAPQATLSTVRLSARGVYAIRVSHAVGAQDTTGHYLLHLGVVSSRRLKYRVGGVLNPGAEVTGSLIPNDSEDTWLLQGHAGEPLTLYVVGLDPTAEPTPLSLRLQDTAGNTFASRDVFLAQDMALLEDIILPLDGLYRVVVIGGGTTTGSYRLVRPAIQERFIPGVINYAQSVGGVFNPTHNAETWTFTGTAGDVISVSMRPVRGDPFKGGFQVLSESGLVLATATDSGDGAEARVERIVLPFSGSYSIITANLDSNFAGAGVYQLGLTLQESKARSIGAGLHDGETNSGDLYPDDPSDYWIFSGRTGDVVEITVQARDHFLKPSLKLQNRVGVGLQSAEADATGGASTGNFSLPADGVYAVLVTGADNSVGSYGINLRFVPPPVPPIPVITYNSRVPGLVADDRPTDTFRFDGQQGDLITARASREPGSPLALTLTLLAPDGVPLAQSALYDGDDVIIKDYTLPTSGSFHLVAGRFNGDTGKTAGRFNLALDAQPAAHAVRGTLISEQRGIGRLDDANPSERWQYNGKAGEVIGVFSAATSGDLDTYLTLQSPSGKTLASNDDDPQGAGTDAVLPGVAFPADGTYTIIISRVGTRSKGSIGNYEIRADHLYTFGATRPPSALISYGERVTGTADATHPEARWTFSGSQNDAITVTLLHTTDDAPPLLTLQDPTGSVLADGALGVGQTTISQFRLPTAGFYDLVVRRPVNARLDYAPFSLTLALTSSPVDSPLNGGVLRGDDVATGVILSGSAGHYWLLQGRSGQSMSLNLMTLTGNLQPNLMLLNPGGQAVLTRSLAQGTSSLALDSILLSVDGIYTLIVTPGQIAQEGTYRISTRSEVSDAQSRPLPPNQTVNGTLNDLHPVDRWQLSASQGEPIGARMLVTTGNLLPILQLRGANGQVLAESRLESSLAGYVAVLDPLNALYTGDYELFAARAAQTAGTYALSMSNGAVSTALVAAQPIAYGQTVLGALQNGMPALYAFLGKKGDAINLVSRPGDAGLTAAIELQDAAGHRLEAAQPHQNESDMQGVVLGADGRYVVAVIPPGSANYSLILQRRQDALPSPFVGRVLVPNAIESNGILPNGIYNYWTFTGKAGSDASLRLAQDNSNVRLDVSVYAPDGAYLVGSAAENGQKSLQVSMKSLPQDGIYQVVVGRWLGPAGTSTGRYAIVYDPQASMTPSPPAPAVATEAPLTLDYQTTPALHLTSPITSKGAIAVGSTALGLIDSGELGHLWTFAAGDSPTIAIALQIDSAGLRLNAVIVDAAGVVLGHATTDVTGQLSMEAPLLGAGTYSLLIEPTAPGHAGRYSFQLGYALAPSGGGTVLPGQSVSGAFTDEDFSDLWRFTANAGQQISVELQRLSGDIDLDALLIAPDGSPLALKDGAGHATLQIAHQTLPQTGTYLLLISRHAGANSRQTGNYALHITTTH